MAKTRKSYTVKEKLSVLAAMRNSGLSRRKFALGRNLNESTLRTWMQQEPRMLELSANKIKKTRYMVERKGFFEDIDAAVLTWVKERNDMGLRVKDKFIRMQALNARDKIVDQTPDDDEGKKAKLLAFGASRIWCHRFKKRNNLRSRRHTTTHKLPYGFRQVAIDFIGKVQQLCKDFKITRERIINFDQVSRYYEDDKSTTIASKGTKEILLRKSSQSHKKFTFTPFITAGGKFVMKHALFSKLKNLPKVDPRCKVDVNGTAMWSISIIHKRIDEAIKITRGLFDHRSGVLVVLDSYPAHVKFVQENEQSYQSKNVHFAIVPPNLTGLLQPLDVALNRSFQQYFNDQTDEYQSQSLSTGLNRTPTTEQLTKWAADWCETKSEHDVKKAFNLCGLVPEGEFDINHLHEPLRGVFDHQFEADAWLKKHSLTVADCFINLNNCIEYRGKHCFLKAIYDINSGEGDEDFDAWLTTSLQQVEALLKRDPLTVPLINTADVEAIRAGTELTTSYLEIYAVSSLIGSPIHMIYLDDEGAPCGNRLVFGSQEAGKIYGFYLKTGPLTLFYDPEYDENDINFAELEDDDEPENSDDNYEDVEYLDGEMLEDDESDERLEDDDSFEDAAHSGDDLVEEHQGELEALEDIIVFDPNGDGSELSLSQEVETAASEENETERRPPQEVETAASKGN